MSLSATNSYGLVRYSAWNSRSYDNGFRYPSTCLATRYITLYAALVGNALRARSIATGIIYALLREDVNLSTNRHAYGKFVNTPWYSKPERPMRCNIAYQPRSKDKSHPQLLPAAQALLPNHRN